MSLYFELTRVSKRFGRRWALANLSLSGHAGTIVLLTGENGAGKTTLLRILATVSKPTFGHLQLFGLEAAKHLHVIRPQLAFITHESHHYDSLSAVENLRLFQQLRGEDDPRAIRRVLDDAGLRRHADRPVSGYSAGMKRRLAMARLLLGRPRLALLDEPFGQLDAEGVQWVEDAIRALRGRGTTCVLSTHDLARGQALSDVHVPLSQGRLASQPPPEPAAPPGPAAATAGEARASGGHAAP